MTLLRLDKISKRFGEVRVADALSFTLDPGEALGIIGPNGAGKSSLFNIVGGDLRADAGRVSFAGEDITNLPAFDRCRAGIGRTYQIPQPFTHMTVFENLLVAATSGGKNESHSAERCATILEATGLIAHANQRAGTLTLLNRKRLELARALASDPKLLLLDEIAGGLTAGEAALLVETIRGIHATGTAIIWIEHVVHALVAVVNRLIVMHLGAILIDGEPRAVMASDEVKRVYLGIGG
jgi:branched-chain amino acid transport system ATP-binding protein